MNFGIKRVATVTFIAGLLVAGTALSEDQKTPKSDTTINVIKTAPVKMSNKGRPTLHLVKDTIITISGLKYIDLRPGTGGQPKEGQTVSVHYVEMLLDGKKIESSRDKEVPYEFQLGKGQVIKGWDEGVASMNIGGLRRLIIPYQLAYGEHGQEPNVPPKSVLVLEVELLGVK